MPDVSSWLRVDWDPTGDPNSVTPSWVDITSEFQSCRISRGRAGVFDLYKVGQLELKARNGRKGVSAPWLDPDVWYRWRQIRVVWTGGVTDIPLFTGYVQTTDHDFNTPNVNFVTIRAVDALGMLKDLQVTFTAVSTQPDDPIWRDNGYAAGNIEQFITNTYGATLDLYGVSTAPIFFPAVEEQDPTATSRRKVRRRTVKGTFWQLLQDALEVEYGTLHAAADGGFAVNGRYAPLMALADGNTVTIADTGTPDYRFTLGSEAMAPPGTDYFDTAVAIGTSKQENRATNPPAGYPETTFSRTNLVCRNDNWLQANADLWATLFSQPEPFASKGTIALDRFDPTDLVTATETLGRYVATITQTPVGSTQKTWQGLIEGIDHEIDANGPWQASPSFTNVARWSGPYGDWDDYGILGSTWTLGTSRLAP